MSKDKKEGVQHMLQIASADKEAKSILKSQQMANIRDEGRAFQ